MSQFTQVVGEQGGGVIPADGATVSIISRKQNFDNFVFDNSKNQFRYLRTNTYYGNNGTDINNLLAASANATPIQNTTNPDQYFADWTLTAYGKTPTAFLQSDEEAVNLAAVVALRDAGANFATSFTRVPDIATWMTEGVQPLSSEATENKGASDE